MDEQLRIILIIIVSVSIFGLLVFVFVKNYVRQKINKPKIETETIIISIILSCSSIIKYFYFLK
mgnify:FL=1